MQQCASLQARPSSLGGRAGLSRDFAEQFWKMFSWAKRRCRQPGEAVDADITTLFAQLRNQHPKLKITEAQSDKMMVDILRGFSRAIDALNPVRNSKSIAHPNTLLDHWKQCWRSMPFGQCCIIWMGRLIEADPHGLAERVIPQLGHTGHAGCGSGSDRTAVPCAVANLPR